MSCPDQETLEDLAECGPFGLDPKTLAHVKACEACQEELGLLRAERRAFASRRVPVALPAFESLRVRPLPTFRSATWGSAPHTWTAGLATLAAAAAALVLHVKAVPRPSPGHESKEVGALACYPPEDAACAASLRSPLAIAEPSWAACLVNSPDSNLACETAQALVCDAETSL